MSISIRRGPQRTDRLPPHVVLNGIDRGKQFKRRQAGLPDGAGIGEKILLDIAPGRSPVDRRNGGQPDNAALLAAERARA